MGEEEPYHEMRRHLPILWTVIKYLNGRDLVGARLIDPYWKNAVDDSLRHLEGIGKSPLKAIKFPNLQTLQHFQASFPAPVPPDGFPIFHFANLELHLVVTTFPEFQQRCPVYCPYLNFLTIGIPASSPHAFQHLRGLLNHCRVLQNLSLMNTWTYNWVESLPEILNPVVLGSLPNLKGLDINCRSFTWIGFEEFLEEFVQAAPNLRKASVSYNGLPATGIPGMLKPLERTPLVNLHLGLRLEGNHDLFNALGGIQLRIRELSLRLLQQNPSPNQEEIRKGLANWLGKLDNTGLQKLSVDSEDFGVRLPAVLNIRSLVVNDKFEKPVEPCQVPNLEDVSLERHNHMSSEATYLIYSSIFAAGKVFPTVNKLQLDLAHSYVNSLEFAFPNLESLEFINADWMLKPDCVTTMRNLLQFPNLVRLSINFYDGSDWEVRGPNIRQEPWWDVFTGGIRPSMNRNTKLKVIHTQLPPTSSPDQNGDAIPVPAPSLFDLIPNLKTLELGNGPEMLLYAVIHLTATEKIQRLETLRLVPICKRYQGIFKHFLPMLKAYHKRVQI